MTDLTAHEVVERAVRAAITDWNTHCEPVQIGDEVAGHIAGEVASVVDVLLDDARQAGPDFVGGTR